MSIEEPQVIDIISSETDGSAVTLTATDHLAWGDREHLMKIQDKLNSYLAYIESGEICESYPNAKGREIRIEVVCKYHPDEEGAKFLSLCEGIIGSAGYRFSYKVHEI